MDDVDGQGQGQGPGTDVTEVAYTRRQIKNDQPGSWFSAISPSILNRFPWNIAEVIFY